MICYVTAQRYFDNTTLDPVGSINHYWLTLRSGQPKTGPVVITLEEPRHWFWNTRTSTHIR